MTRSWRHRPLLPNNGIFIADGLRCGIRVYSDAGVRDECDDELLSAGLPPRWAKGKRATRVSRKWWCDAIHCYIKRKWSRSKTGESSWATPHLADFILPRAAPLSILLRHHSHGIGLFIKKTTSRLEKTHTHSENKNKKKQYEQGVLRRKWWCKQ